MKRVSMRFSPPLPNLVVRSTYGTQLYRNLAKSFTRFACQFGEPVAAECSRMFLGGRIFALMAAVANAVANDDCY